MIQWINEEEAYIGDRNNLYYHILYNPYRGRMHIFWHTYMHKDLFLLIDKNIECTHTNPLILYAIDKINYMDKYNEIPLANI